MVDNSCKSGNVNLDKAIRKWYRDFILGLTLAYDNLLNFNDGFLDCCEETNKNLVDIINQLDILIQNLIDCCEGICDGLDKIIDELDDGLPVEYYVEWKEHICQEDEEENLTDDDYKVTWDDYLCVEADEEELPESLFDYEIEFQDYICEETWGCDLEAYFVECVDEVEIDYDVEWGDYVCVQEFSELTTTDEVTTTIPVTTTEELTTSELFCDYNGVLTAGKFEIEGDMVYGYVDEIWSGFQIGDISPTNIADDDMIIALIWHEVSDDLGALILLPLSIMTGLPDYNATELIINDVSYPFIISGSGIPDTFIPNPFVENEQYDICINFEEIVTTEEITTTEETAEMCEECGFYLDIIIGD